MDVDFFLITTTYKRPDIVLRCLKSIRSQTYQNWQMIIVIDDTESDYSLLTQEAETETRITVIENIKNEGKNNSVNKAFAILRDEPFTGFVVFLDDDDWLAETCLDDFSKAIKQNPSHKWFVSQRLNTQSNTSLTENNTGKEIINYKQDVLLKKDFTGDATHCIYFTPVQNVAFPKKIKNAEEWLYFSEVSKQYPTFVYIPTPGTLSEGYGENGLSDQYHNLDQRKENNPQIIKEVWERKLFSHIVLLYCLGRFIKSIT